MTDVEYYYLASDFTTVIIHGTTNVHHNTFYSNPLGHLLFALDCSICPNKHCKDVFDNEEGHVIIDVSDWLCSIERETTVTCYEPKGLEVFANMFQQAAHKCRQLENKVEALKIKLNH